MAIAAQRFSLMSQETNVAVASFTKGMDSAVFNDPAKVLKEAQDGLTSLVGSLTQSGQDLLASIDTDPLKAVSRLAKDIKGQINDLKALPSKALDDVLGSLGMSSPGVSKGLKSILDRCSSNGLGKGLPGKPYDTSMNCGNGNVSMGKGGATGNGCNAAGYNDILNKLTGGEYNAAFKDYNSALKALMALSGYGYGLGMCGVFGALSKGLPGDVASKAAGSLLSSLGVGGNATGFMDVAKSAVGLNTLALSPSSVSDFLGNYTSPSWLKETSFGDMGERITGAAELVDADWASSDYDGALSLKSCTQWSSDLDDSFNIDLTNRSFALADLDEAPDDDDTFLKGGYRTNMSWETGDNADNFETPNHGMSWAKDIAGISDWT